MKTFFATLSVVMLGLVVARASDDPVRDFLHSPAPYVRSPGFYATDEVLRIDLDLQGNGQIETLVTLNRDRDGQQGNIWKVYKKNVNGYQPIGTMTFSRDRFYLGRIEELDHYGLLTYGPAGAHRGSVRAYIDDGDSIRDMSLTGVESLADLSKEGRPFKKYFRDKGINGAELIMAIDAKELAQKYGIKIEKASYLDSLNNALYP